MFLVKCGKIGITKGADNIEKEKTGVMVSLKKSAPWKGGKENGSVEGL